MSLSLIEELRANATTHPLDVRLQVLVDAADALESQAREIERLTNELQNTLTDWGWAKLELAALKAQPGGVVPAEFIEHVKHARKELCRLEQSPLRIRQQLAQKLTDGIARLNSSPVSAGNYQDDPRTPQELSLAGCKCVRYGEGNPHWPCEIHSAVMAGDKCNCPGIGKPDPSKHAHNCPYRLTQASVSAGGVDERAAFDAYFCAEQGFPIGTDTTHIGAAFAPWRAWQARAALSAPSHGEQVRDWNLAADELPACGKPVLAYYLNSHGMGRRIRAMHVKRFTVEAEEFADPDTQCCEYSEQDDCYYTTEGWYELIDNWPDYSSCAVIEGVVTHWMPLPAAPSAGSQKEQGE